MLDRLEAWYGAGKVWVVRNPGKVVVTGGLVGGFLLVRGAFRLLAIFF